MPPPRFGSHQVCIICLSEDGDISSKHTHLGCKCNVPVHSECWMRYIESKKGTMECPICHVITIGNPILTASITGMPKNLRDVPSLEAMRNAEERDKCAGKCMCGCLVWWFGTIILAAVFG